ncbi:MAG: hypothetical protein EOL87_01295 [Spartobacteria bacterium]|nr:hypothetical protein [Spartobacteria bacterium]
MQLTTHLQPSRILVQQNAKDKYELIKRMVNTITDDHFLRVHSHCQRDHIVDSVIRREHERSTAMGEGIALPHARLSQFSGFAVALATLAKPIEYNAPDELPVDIVCMVLTSQNDPTISLKIMSRLASFLSKPGNRQKLLAATDPADVQEMLSGAEFAIDVPIRARDVMRTPRFSAGIETPMKEITRIMNLHQLPALPILDDIGRIAGEITGDSIMKLGLPEFFTHLKSVSFIEEFDPFEQYFKAESKHIASEIMNTKVSKHSVDTTIMQIVFDLAVKNYPQVYIVDENEQWIGIIDRGTVIDNVISF